MYKSVTNLGSGPDRLTLEGVKILKFSSFYKLLGIQGKQCTGRFFY